MEKSFEIEPELSKNEKIQFAIDTFFELSKSKGFEPQIDEQLTLEDDLSLLFTNSTISRYKQHIIENRLPEKGYAISQKCLRTWGLSEYQEKESDFDFNSYFTMIGVLFPGENPREILPQTLEYFEKIGFDKKRIYIKTSKSNNNVNRCLDNLRNDQILFDTELPSFYNWVYGSQKIKGEGVTLSYKKEDGSLDDLGNIIAILNTNDDIVAWESGFGTETIIGVRDNKNLFSCHKIWDILEYQNNKDIRKIADCIISIIAIIQEGIVLDAKKQGYILRKYLTTIYYLNKNTNLPIKNIIISYCNTFKIPNGIEIGDKYEKYIDKIHQSKIQNYSNFKRYLHKNKNTPREDLIKIAKESFSLALDDIIEII